MRKHQSTKRYGHLARPRVGGTRGCTEAAPKTGLHPSAQLSQRCCAIVPVSARVQHSHSTVIAQSQHQKSPGHCAGARPDLEAVRSGHRPAIVGCVRACVRQPCLLLTCRCQHMGGGVAFTVRVLTVGIAQTGRDNLRSLHILPKFMTNFASSRA